MSRRIESLFIPGPAGRLEALLEEPDDREPIAAALVCHPHPQHGGTMHNKVVYRIARGLRASGAVVLRFNYRGVNLSEGTYDHGIGEIEDARTALGVLRERYPALPFLLAGFSFGSRIVQKLGCPMPDVRRIIAVGFPVLHLDGGKYTECPVPRTFIHSPNDQFGPRDAFQPFFDSLRGENQLIWVESKDHFFAGALDEFEAAMKSVPLV